MTRDSESNNKERFIVLVVVSVNATVSVLLIAGMVYSFTLITQQQDEITNLHRLLHKSMPAKQQSKKQSTADEHEEVISIETRLKVRSLNLLFLGQGKFRLLVLALTTNIKFLGTERI